MEWLKGKKTYIAVGLGVIFSGLLAMGIIDQPTFNTIAAICGFLGIGFLRAGVAETNGKNK